MQHSSLTSTLMRALGASFVALALAAPASAQVPVAPQPTESFLRHLADLINVYRQRHGLEPLTFADELAGLADEHSSNMSSQRQLSHEGFRSRMGQARSRMCVENVGWNYRTPEGLLQGWVQSPGHHRNLLEPEVSRMGLAISTRYVTFFACA